MTEDYAEKVFPILREASVQFYGRRNSCRYKPLIGGVWGNNRFHVASFPLGYPNEFIVYYAVQEVTSGLLLSFAEVKTEALGLARRVLERVSPQRLAEERSLHFTACRKFDADTEQAHREYVARLEKDVEAGSPKVKSIPKRRQRIFEESGGRCHYCETALTLDGVWHIEHKMPRALGGGNDPGNLVASCVPCNMKKRDTTDVEFKARLSKEAA